MPPVIHRDILPRDLDPKADPSLSELNERFKELYKNINVLFGYHGDVPLAGTINLNGNRITNLGAPQSTTDALSQTSADPMYSTAVQRTAMEAIGSQMLQTTRRLNDGVQQHTVSSDLNTQGSIPPSNITGTLAYTSVAGSSVTFTWTSIVIQLADLSYKAIQNGTLTVTGLSNAMFYFYPDYDTKLGILTFVADSVNAVGAPAIAFPQSVFASGSTAAAQQQTADGRIALTDGNTNPALITINGTPGGVQLRTQ